MSRAAGVAPLTIKHFRNHLTVSRILQAGDQLQQPAPG